MNLKPSIIIGRSFESFRDTRLSTELRAPSSKLSKYERRYVASKVSAEGRQSALFGKILDCALPPSVVLDSSRNVIHTFGDASRYLRLGDGEPSLDLLNLLRKDLKLVAAAAIQRASRERTKITFPNVATVVNGVECSVTLSATPISDDAGNADHTLVTFAEVELPQHDHTELDHTEHDLAFASRDRIEYLEAELTRNKENLQATIEELEASNQELQATNEEMLASNEELQSTNEELHSVNEELYTVNSEFQDKMRSSPS